MNENNVESKKIVSDIIMVMFSNIIKLVAGILIGFAIPKLMGSTNYGYYKTYTLYLNYIGILNFGFIDGIYLLFAGKKYDELNKEQFRCYTRFISLLEFGIAILICSISIFIVNQNYKFILFFTGVTLFANNITYHYQFISQITGQFKQLSVRNIITALLQIFSVLVVYVLCLVQFTGQLDYRFYIPIYVLIYIIMAGWYAYTYRDLTFGKAALFKEEKDNILMFFKVGFPLLVANVTSSLIMSIDRQYVNILANNGKIEMADYGVYSFAYTMLALITTVIGAISVVLYPTIKNYSEEKLTSDYNKLIGIIACVTGVCVAAYYPLVFIVEHYLQNYTDSLPIFRVILPGVILSSCVNMIIFNYYKAEQQHLKFFKISILILLLSAVADVIAYNLTRTLFWISGVSVVVMAIWYFVAEYPIVKKRNINPWKNNIYIITIIAGYYLITSIISNVFFGLAIYLVFYLSISFVFHKSLLMTLPSLFFRRR